MVNSAPTRRVSINAPINGANGCFKLVALFRHARVFRNDENFALSYIPEMSRFFDRTLKQRCGFTVLLIEHMQGSDHSHPGSDFKKRRGNSTVLSIQDLLRPKQKQVGLAGIQIIRHAALRLKTKLRANKISIKVDCSAFRRIWTLNEDRRFMHALRRLNRVC